MHRVGWAAAWALVIIAAAALRWFSLEDRQLWLDENCTYYWSSHFRSPVPGGADPWNEPAHIPYFYLLSWWMRAAGESGWALRAFSAVFGLLTIPLLGLIAWRIGGAWSALTAGFLAAVHPLHIHYSQEARAYTMWTFGLCLALFFLHWAARTNRPRAWVGYGAVAWACVLTHYYTLLWLPATVLAILLTSDRRRFLRRWSATHLVILLGLTPFIVWWMLPYIRTGAEGWKREVWLAYPPILAIPKSLWALLPSGGYPESYLGPLALATGEVFGPSVSFVLTWGPAACTAMLVGFARMKSARTAFVSPEGGEKERTDRRRDSPAGAWSAVFCFLLSGAFLLTAWTAALLLGRGYLVGRYDFAAWPTMTLGLAGILEHVGTRRTHGRLMASVSAVLFVACGLTTWAGVRSLPAANDVPERARRMAAMIRPDDWVVSTGLYRWFMLHEWERIGFSPRVRSFPTWHDRQLCWDDPRKELENPAALDDDARTVAEEMERTLSEGKVVWLLAHGEPSGPRWEADRLFFAELRRRNLEIDLRDEWVGLARVRTDR